MSMVSAIALANNMKFFKENSGVVLNKPNVIETKKTGATKQKVYISVPVKINKMGK